MPEEMRTPLTDGQAVLAVKAFNLMGGVIDWAGLATICEMLGITDIELLINQFEVLRDYG